MAGRISPVQVSTRMCANAYLLNSNSALFPVNKISRLDAISHSRDLRGSKTHFNFIIPCSKVSKTSLQNPLKGQEEGVKGRCQETGSTGVMQRAGVTASWDRKPGAGGGTGAV